MKPKTIYEIYEEILALRMGIICFRIRNTETNKDYLIYNEKRWLWDEDHMPYKVIGLLLEDNFNEIHSLDCENRNWALLSSQKEIQYFRTINQGIIADLLKINYHADVV